MGKVVLGVVNSAAPHLRTYAHCTKDRVCVYILIHLCNMRCVTTLENCLDNKCFIGSQMKFLCLTASFVFFLLRNPSCQYNIYCGASDTRNALS